MYEWVYVKARSTFMLLKDSFYQRLKVYMTEHVKPQLKKWFTDKNDRRNDLESIQGAAFFNIRTRKFSLRLNCS